MTTWGRHRAIWALLCAGAYVGALAIGPAIAHAETPQTRTDATGGGDLSENGHVEVHVTVSTPGGGASGAPDASATPLLRWQVLGDGAAKTGDLSGLCFVPGADASHPTAGFQYRIIGTDPAGTIVVDMLECVPFPGEGRSVPPPTIPRLPTLGAAWAQAQLPTPVVTVDPPARGITGLETGISTADEPRALTLSAHLDGYIITGTATFAGYVLSVDGGPPTTATGTRITFETKGPHTIAISAVWRATATLTGGVLAVPVATDLGTATIAATRTYQVDEVRAVLQP